MLIVSAPLPVVTLRLPPPTVGVPTTSLPSPKMSWPPPPLVKYVMFSLSARTCWFGSPEPTTAWVELPIALPPALIRSTLTAGALTVPPFGVEIVRTPKPVGGLALGATRLSVPAARLAEMAAARFWVAALASFDPTLMIVVAPPPVTVAIGASPFSVKLCSH